MKLDFVIIGGMKCGSTALGEYFRKHPEINFCKMIETDYFSHNSQKIQTLEKYFNTFFEVSKSGLMGESSPTYSYLSNLPLTANKLYTSFPNLKIIFIVRNPINRIKSHLNHLILENVKIDSNTIQYLKDNPSIIEKTKFGKIAQYYINIFGKESVKIIPFEQIISGAGLKEACDFLNINYDFKDLPEANKTDKRYYSMPLINFYKKNFLKIYNIPGWKYIKSPLKGIIDKLFSRKMKTQDFVKINQTSINYITDRLEEDRILFEKLTGSNYFELSS